MAGFPENIANSAPNRAGVGAGAKLGNSHIFFVFLIEFVCNFQLQNQVG